MLFTSGIDIFYYAYHRNSSKQNKCLITHTISVFLFEMKHFAFKTYLQNKTNMHWSCWEANPGTVLDLPHSFFFNKSNWKFDFINSRLYRRLSEFCFRFRAQLGELLLLETKFQCDSFKKPFFPTKIFRSIVGGHIAELLRNLQRPVLLVSKRSATLKETLLRTPNRYCKRFQRQPTLTWAEEWWGRATCKFSTQSVPISPSYGRVKFPEIFENFRLFFYCTNG